MSWTGLREKLTASSWSAVVFCLSNVIGAAIWRFSFNWLPSSVIFSQGVNFGCAGLFFDEGGICSVCSWAWETLAHVLTITQIINPFTLINLPLQNPWFILRIVSTRRWNSLRMGLSLISKCFTFTSKSEVAIWCFPRQTDVVLWGFWFATGVVSDVVKVRHFAVFGHYACSSPRRQTTFNNSVSLNPKLSMTLTPSSCLLLYLFLE